MHSISISISSSHWLTGWLIPTKMVYNLLLLLFENPFLDASGNPVTATVPTTVETVVVTDASGSTVTGKFERFVYHNFIL